MRFAGTPVPGCPGTYVEEIGQANGLNRLKVMVEPGGSIPLHTHKGAATMIVFHGRALALGNNPRMINPGDVVIKRGLEPHGFDQIGEDGFGFVSEAETTIVADGELQDITFL